jgi:chromosome segregation ATPase
MVFVLGFLVASLLALAIAPAFWQRAIRLSKRRLEMQLPLSPEEILAGRDQLRAEFAVEQRRLEQKIETLNRIHAADMVELGRRAVIMAAQEADLAALSQQGSEAGAELNALRRTLAETSAELAATAKEHYDTAGLVARKDAQIRELTEKLDQAVAFGARLEDAVTALEAEKELQSRTLAVQAETIERLEGEVSTLQLQHQADQVVLKTAAARVADHEEALEAAIRHEKDLIRHQQIQAEAAHASEASFLEKIEKLRRAHAASEDALAAAQRKCDSLKQELAELRAAMPPPEAEAMRLQREENEALRRKIDEIGAAIIRAAGGSAESQPEEELAESGFEGDTLSQKQATA